MKTPAGARLAIEQCTKALALDGEENDTLTGELRKRLSPAEKAKAHFRRGQAYLFVNEPDSAYADFTKASEFEPSDAAIKQSMGIAKKATDVIKQKERARMAKLFS